MKATTVPPLAPVAPADRSWGGVFCDLVKARLTFLVTLTTLAGFYLGSQGGVDYVRMLHTLAATALVACGAAALNQWLERDYDARMRRTAQRPLPAGRLQPDTVLVLGGAFSVAGLAYLAGAVNPTASLLGAVTLAIYLFVYTPLKRVSWINTHVGAIPGALPPLMGWAAARQELSLEGWSLFAILFFWQVPHFLAIAWLYREEYARAGFVMLPTVDPSGERTGHQAIRHTLALLLVSLCPVVFSLSGVLYLTGALVLGTVFFGLAVSFARQLSVSAARRLFLFSVLYVPLLFGLMVLDKVRF